MNPNDRTVLSRFTSPPARWILAVVGLALLFSDCASDDTGSAGGGGETTLAAASISPDERAAPSTAATSDQELANAALLTPEDLEGDFRALPEEGDWPYSAELVRQIPACEPFADSVFGGGAQHAPSATVTLEREISDLFTYVVVFPTAEEATTLMSAVKSSEFDDCWEQYMDVAAVAWTAGITEAHYTKAVPPDLALDADDSFTRKVEGTIVLDGAESGDSCVCVFSQVGRAVVLVHSAAEQFDNTERKEMTQKAIEKLRTVMGT